MLKDKIKSCKSGILFYGITPPKAKHTQEEIQIIAQKHIDRIQNLDIDGLVLYDIQDEADRTQEERPFPFIQTIEPTFYSETYLNDLKIPRIVYKAVGKYSEEEMITWLEETKKNQHYSVFVGAAAVGQKLTINLREAYKLKENVNNNLILGGITIPERHTKKQNEHLTVFGKIESGCEFFVSQAVYNLEAAKQFLKDYRELSLEKNKPMVPIIFTITPCGSVKTLDFMKWLGINIPQWLEEDLKQSGNILQASVKLSKEIFEELYKYGKENGIPIGCNVESVAIRKEEIDASIELLHEIKDIITKYEN